MKTKDITLNCGLKLKYIKSPFMRFYCGFGVKFGGRYDKYLEENGTIKNIKPGVAHFLEHMLFKNEDKTDATLQFDKLNVFANAYTSKEQTIYYISGLESFYESLDIFVKMFFSPSFDSEVIDNERKIIEEEFRNKNDNLEQRILEEEVKALFPNDPYSINILGTYDSIMSINKDDLYDAYKSFYTIDNTYLVIVSNKDEEDVIDYLNKILNSMNLNYHKKELILENKEDIITNIELKNDYNSNLLVLQFKSFKYNYSDPIILEKISIVLHELFSCDRGLFKDLLDNDLLLDYDYDFTTLSASNMIAVQIVLRPTDLKKVREMLLNSLNKLNIKMIREKSIDEEKKRVLSENLRILDKPDTLGEKVLSLWMEDLDYFTLIDKTKNISKNDLLDIIEIFKKSNYSILEKNVK